MFPPGNRFANSGLRTLKPQIRTFRYQRRQSQPQQAAVKSQPRSWQRRHKFLREKMHGLFAWKNTVTLPIVSSNPELKGKGIL
jgi:phage portal protein BeeE